MLDISVVVPVRNAEHWIDECLSSIARQHPREILVVDGMSTDRTVEIAQRYPVRILSDGGRGVAAARSLGVDAARSPWVALIDVDVVLPDGSLPELFAEYRRGNYQALQAGLRSVSGPGYWGRALVNHHRSGLLKNWFGLGATIFDRCMLLEHNFDPTFLSGEDIELRWRLRQAGAKLGVSRRTTATHRFEDTFEFARDQWLADGSGLGRMIAKYQWRARWLLALPLAAGLRGIVLSLSRGQVIWLPYYVCYLLFNYVGMFGELRKHLASFVAARFGSRLSAKV